MAQRVSPEEHIEQFFRTQKGDACAVQRDKIDLIMRVRFPDLAPVKRGRKKKTKEKTFADRIFEATGETKA